VSDAVRLGLPIQVTSLAPARALRHPLPFDEAGTAVCHDGYAVLPSSQTVGSRREALRYWRYDHDRIRDRRFCCPISPSARRVLQRQSQTRPGAVLASGRCHISQSVRSGGVRLEANQ
jgi:hypothetical protein